MVVSLALCALQGVGGTVGFVTPRQQLLRTGCRIITQETPGIWKTLGLSVRRQYISYFVSCSEYPIFIEYTEYKRLRISGPISDPDFSAATQKMRTNSIGWHSCRSEDLIQLLATAARSVTRDIPSIFRLALSEKLAVK